MLIYFIIFLVNINQNSDNNLLDFETKKHSCDKCLSYPVDNENNFIFPTRNFRSLQSNNGKWHLGIFSIILYFLGIRSNVHPSIIFKEIFRILLDLNFVIFYLFTDFFYLFLEMESY